MSDTPITIPPAAFAAADELRQRLEAAAPSKYLVGIGMKETAGRFEDRLAIFVYVDEKHPIQQVPEAERIPASVGGYVTDVAVFRPVPTTDVNRYDPMRGGIQISRPVPGNPVIGVVSFGTLGCIVRRRLDQQLLLLTCAHVVDALNQKMHQPALGETGAQVIGLSVDMRTAGAPLLHDFAVIEPNTLRGLQKTIEGIGPVKGVAIDAAATMNAVVKKRGARTLLTTGRVKRLIPGGVPAVSLLEIISEPPGQLFAGKGDSGSVVLNEDDDVVGLLYAVPNEDLGPELASRGLAIPIETVQATLQVDVAVEPVITSVAPNSTAALGFPPVPVVIDGWGFSATSQVIFDQLPALVLFAGPRRLHVVPPPHFPGTVDVRVRNAAGDTSAVGAQAQFTY